MDSLKDIVYEYKCGVEKTRGNRRYARGVLVLIVCYLVVVVMIPNYRSIVQQGQTRASTVTTKKSSLKLAHPLCRKLSSSSDSSEQWPVMSASNVWQSFRNELLNASYATQDTDNERFRPWVTGLFDWYTTDRMERSLSFPASSASMRHILKIIDDYPTTKEPLQILVMGGSVTAGHGCMENTIGVEDKRTPKGNSPFFPCAWPTRLELLLNEFLFGGEPVVKVTNLAVGGSSSEVGSMILEYGLFPKNFTLPHIVLSAFSANDGTSPLGKELIFQYMQDYVRAASNLRCEGGLPMVVSVDDFHGIRKPMQSMEHSAALHTISSWYHLMAISYPNVIRHAVYANLENNTSIHPLMSSSVIGNIHLGLGFHLGMTWVVLFNLLNAVVKGCNDILSDESNSNTPKNTLDVDELSPKYISQMDSDLTFPTLAREWRSNIASAASRCENNANTVEVCASAWMVNRLAGIERPKDVKKQLKPVLKSSNGWEATGFPIRQPRTGWYANLANATFDLEYKNISLESKFLTVLYLKSYSAGYKDSLLVVTMEVIHQGAGNSTSASSVSEIKGYHESKTSVHYPHKMKLPGGGARVGDTVRVTFQLVSGSVFKIAGIAMCSR
jgi:hypothetical protein